MIMQESKHCALSGEGALKFAKEKKFPVFDPQDLIAPRAECLNVKYPDYEAYVNHHYKGEPLMECQDTVSAVAMDANGHFACATSTGGIAGKYKGRVGDAPLVGCGGYANEYGAATTTGEGESIIKVTLAREVVYMMQHGIDAQESAENAVSKMEQRVGGYGGVIAIDKRGRFGKAFNTTQMIWTSIKNNQMESGMPVEKNDDLNSRLNAF
ncbi:isoaspartyl peptidase/L-asparaginase-like isoform X2 [Dendronephthya gigantea]|uniref:isoaspartyl peptidase/L-asparaginase-like isoform X2 n=1 Tax=Dendronephthya gigantea TaxID=151771 RepID=UPI00106988E1|nr:isoaspartyl peptidase/L-asparaginase-like isoform X2 [Dendronephthya gigantea]